MPIGSTSNHWSPPKVPETAIRAMPGPLREAWDALADAVAALVEEPGVQVVGVSGLWHTVAVGGPEQPEYTNAVVLLETALAPAELLALAHRLEQAAGRVRDVRWGPRTLDVDVLDVDGVSSADPQLTVPHPRAHERAFVLVPWAEVAPEWLLAPAEGVGRSVRSWAEAARAAEPLGSVVLAEDGAWWR